MTVQELIATLRTAKESFQGNIPLAMLLEMAAATLEEQEMRLLAQEFRSEDSQ